MKGSKWLWIKNLKSLYPPQQFSVSEPPGRRSAMHMVRHIIPGGSAPVAPEPGLDLRHGICQGLRRSLQQVLVEICSTYWITHNTGKCLDFKPEPGKWVPVTCWAMPQLIVSIFRYFHLKTSPVLRHQSSLTSYTYSMQIAFYSLRNTMQSSRFHLIVMECLALKCLNISKVGTPELVYSTVWEGIVCGGGGGNSRCTHGSALNSVSCELLFQPRLPHPTLDGHSGLCSRDHAFSYFCR